MGQRPITLTVRLLQIWFISNLILFTSFFNKTNKKREDYILLFANTYKGPGSDAELFMSETS